MSNRSMDDLEFARQLQEEYDREVASKLPDDDIPENRFAKVADFAVKRKSSGASSTFQGLSPVDPSLELSDPNPNIHELFLQFNAQFFWSRLAGIEVKWSPRMTLCAGLCVYEGRGGLCSVRLSLPLLKLRPRKDLVETLLHEMIHAYLFVTNNDRDHDGHGPTFQKHMHRINKETGAKISIYHTFHDEVEVHRQHWWRCNGPCQRRPPYYGYVKRAMNRAPSAQDFWWAEHRATCGGTYTKIKEPEGYGQKKGGKGKNKEGNQSQISSSSKDLRTFWGKGKVLGGTSSTSKTHTGKNVKDNSSKTKGKPVLSIDSDKKTKNSSNRNVPGNKPSPLFSSVNGVTSDCNNRITKPSERTSSDIEKKKGDGKLIPNGIKSTSSSSSTSRASEFSRSDDIRPSTSKLNLHSTEMGSKAPVDNSSDSNSNHFTDCGDEWLDDVNDVWILKEDDIKPDSSSSNVSSQHTNKSTRDDVIDLTGCDFSDRVAGKKRDNSKKSKNPGQLSQRTDKIGDFKITSKGKNKHLNGDKTKSKLGKNFVSVCEGGAFYDSSSSDFKQKKVKKKYVIDELDSNDDLWDKSDKSCEEDVGITAMHKNNTVDLGSDSEQNPEVMITKKVPPMSDNGGHINAVNVINGQVSRSGDNMQTFSGQGHRLGSAETGATYLSQIRKTFQHKHNGTVHTHSPIASTGACKSQVSDTKSRQRENDMRDLSSSRKKRTSDSAFGESSSTVSGSEVLGSGNKKHCGQRDNTNTAAASSSADEARSEMHRHEDVIQPTRDTNSNAATGLVPCPVCTTMVSADGINDHLDFCLLSS